MTDAAYFLSMRETVSLRWHKRKEIFVIWIFARRKDFDLQVWKALSSKRKKKLAEVAKAYYSDAFYLHMSVSKICSYR